MSDLPTPERIDELCKLIAALHDKTITPEELARLEQYVCHDEDACRLYVEYTHLYANLRWRHMAEQDTDEPLPPVKKEGKGTPILGFLGDAFQQGVDFFSRGLVVSLMLAIGLPALILAVLIVQLSRETVPSAPVPVATITQTHECVWAKGTTRLPIGEGLFPGQRLHLSKGLVEIVFADGASVILEGPSAFAVKHGGEGFLRGGRLVAKVPKQAQGFTIDTPAATVVDYGTEFGVAVDGGGGVAEVQVFQGEVSVEPTPRKANQVRDQHRLKAGSAARVELAAASRKAVFRPISLSSDRYVRNLPSPPKPAERAIVADFSGGNGNAKIDQFPGTAGAGWAGGWYTRQAEGMKCTASVERANPLLDGSDYLRVLVERLSGEERVRRTVERRLDLHEMVDLTKPHVVSMVFRLDALSGFDKSPDQFIICNNAWPEAELKGGPWSGWHIRFDAQDYKQQAKAKHWTFISGNGMKGGETRIDSGIPVREGAIYSFRVLVDPEARQWTPSIAVDGGPWTQFNPMGMRSYKSTQECGYWPNLYFYWILEGGNRGGEVERLGFSVDSIKITSAQ